MSLSYSGQLWNKAPSEYVESPPILQKVAVSEDYSLD